MKSHTMVYDAANNNTYKIQIRTIKKMNVLHYGLVIVVSNSLLNIIFIDTAADHSKTFQSKIIGILEIVQA